MLNPHTSFPYVGSYALLIDEDAPAPQAMELVRIQWRREGEVVVSFPLRDGAGGTKRVAPDQLIDGTPLTDAEQHELTDLSRRLSGRTARTRRRRAMQARHDHLRRRSIDAPILSRLLRQAAVHGAFKRAA